MRHSGFGYFIGEAIGNLAKNAVMTIASIITVTGCLLLLGAFLLFGINLNYVGEQVQAQCELQAFVSKESPRERAQGILNLVSELPHVKTAVLETKEQAFLNYREMLGEDAVALDGLEDEDFLRYSVKITLDDIRFADSVVKSAGEIDGVDEVRNRKELVDKIIAMTDFIKKISMYSMLLLAVIAIFIISNTIKLAVHSREEEIHIMKYVGATDWFIRWPFIIEGVLVGLAGAGIALFAIFGGYASFVRSFTDFLDIFRLKSLAELSGLLLISILGFGTVMGAVGSIISIRRHLKV